VNIEAVNFTLTRAIMGLQAGEIDSMVEAMAVGLSSYDVPPPKGVAFGHTGAYKIPSPPPMRKPRKAQKRKRKVKLSATKKKQLITKIYKALPAFNKSIVADSDGWLMKATLKQGGRHRVVWSGDLARAMGRSAYDEEFLDELTDIELRLMADELGVGASKIKQPLAGMTWKATNKGEKLMNRVSGEKLYQVLKYMRDSNMGAIINDVFIDMTTAALVVKLADRYQAVTRKKFLNMPVDEAGMYAWGFFSKRGGVSFKRQGRGA